MSSEGEARSRLETGEVTAADLCYSLQETVFAMLVASYPFHKSLLYAYFCCGFQVG